MTGRFKAAYQVFTEEAVKNEPIRPAARLKSTNTIHAGIALRVLYEKSEVIRATDAIKYPAMAYRSGDPGCFCAIVKSHKKLENLPVKSFSRFLNEYQSSKWFSLQEFYRELICIRVVVERILLAD